MLILYNIVYTLFNELHIIIQHTREETLKYNLQRAFLPDLSDCEMLTLNDMIQHVFLIEGVATDPNSKIKFKGPSYISHSVQQLLFQVS